MRSIERHDGEASMAQTARDTATDDETWTRHDQIWAAHFTASRHARLAARWMQQAANLTGERAEQAHAIADRHRAAAEEQADKGVTLAQVRSNPPPPAEPAPAEPVLDEAPKSEPVSVSRPRQ
jgi:hypothetical protein